MTLKRRGRKSSKKTKTLPILKPLYQLNVDMSTMVEKKANRQKKKKRER